MNTCKYCYTEFEDQPGPIQVCPRCGEEIQLRPTTEESTFDLDYDSADSDDFELSKDVDDPHLRETAHAPIAQLEDGDAFDQTMQATRQLDGDDFDPEDDERTEQATEYYDPKEEVQPPPTIQTGPRPTLPGTLEYAEREIVGLTGSDTVLPNQADYVIEPQKKDSELGSGATGIVFKAKQKSLDRTVAIKLLKKQMHESSGEISSSPPPQKDIDKFLYESQITAGLDHPNVITVHDLGVTSNNTLFYSMKMFEGGNDWNKSFDQNSLEENLDIFNDVCDAMRRAHRDRIIHRDLKPQNVLVGEFGEVQVTDWGLALDLRKTGNQSFSGGGTPCYMAPEMSKHYLAQHNIKELRIKYEWARANAPGNKADLIHLEQQISEFTEQEKFCRQQINELSDVYVMGAILFHIASGYPPHLFQLGDVHRSKWGQDAGKKKIERELTMSATGEVAKYVVKDMSEPEAREALRDIALKAMQLIPAKRLQSIGILQEKVRDFREFLVCIEATHRGHREVEQSQSDKESYVQLNNAVHAYEGALKNYPDYQPAKDGLAKARFLFAERALNNQDFELGLSTMTEDEVDFQPNHELASLLRQQLLLQRNRRDRRKKMLVVATMASLVSISIGSVFAVLAIVANNSAIQSRAEAAEQIQIADRARGEEKTAKSELLAKLEEYQAIKAETDSLQVQKQTATVTLDQINQRASVAKAEATLAQSSSDLTAAQKEEADLRAKIANKRASVAKLSEYQAQIDAEKIKENTQFEQYLDHLNKIQASIGEKTATSKLRQLFDSKDISLSIKNGWESHHLFKKAHPNNSPSIARLNEHFKLIAFSLDGSTGVAVSDSDMLYRLGANQQPKPFKVDSISDRNILSIDISDDGRWLVVAAEAPRGNAAKHEQILPVIVDMNTNQQVPIADSTLENLQLRASTIEGQNANHERMPQKEKFFCKPQVVDILESDQNQLFLFMVDRRVAKGLNQLRCSTLDLSYDGNMLTGVVKKTKVAGQAFLRNPGLLTSATCLADAVKTRSGEVIAAVSNSQPGFGLVVFSLDSADKLLNQQGRPLLAKQEQKFFSSMRRQRIALNNTSVDFAPTALKIVEGNSDGIKVLVGNGKGEIAEFDFTPSSVDTFMYEPIRHRMLVPNVDDRHKLVSVSPQDKSPESRQIQIRRQSNVFSSTNPTTRTAAPTIAPAHKSAVRAIRIHGNRVFSASESELAIWEIKSDGLTQSATLFGHSGKIGDMTLAETNEQVHLVSVDNQPAGGSEFLQWSPDSNLHKATIALQDFRSESQSRKRIVTGSADKHIGSDSIVLAFDDGTLEYVHATNGTIRVDRPHDAALKNQNARMSRDDFRNGRFAYFENDQRLVMYSNTVGLKTWNLGEEKQTDPKISTVASTEISNGTKPENTAIYFSADAQGHNIVTSHPEHRDRFVLWQLRTDKTYAAQVIEPLKGQTGFSQGLKVVAQPAISPDGSVIACVLRFRNAFQVYLLPTTPSSNMKKIDLFKSDRRTNFRSIHFLNNQQIMIAQDTFERNSERVTSIVHLEQSGGQWNEQIVKLPSKLTDKFNQISVSDVKSVGDSVWFAGFGVANLDRESDSGKRFSQGRKLIAWNTNGNIYQRELPFTRRIAPRFDNNRLTFLADDGNGSKVLESIELSSVNSDGSAESRKMVLESINNHSVRRWEHAGDGWGVIGGDGWLYLTPTDSENSSVKLSYSLANIASKIELADTRILVHHQDKSISLVSLDIKKGSTKSFHRAIGLYDYASLSPDGKQVAMVSAKDASTKIDTFERGESKPITIPVKPIAVAWVRSQILAGHGIKVDGAHAIVTLTRGQDALTLNVWNKTGQAIEISGNLQTLPLPSPRNGATVKSFDISNVTGELVSLVWANKDNTQADVWKLVAADKPGNPKQWFPVDLSKLGQIKSIHIGETVDSNLPVETVAPRLVICADDQGSKSIRLYALELAMQFQTRQLVDLYLADKLQAMDKIIGARFSGDGKTLLTMTSERAKMQLSSGWHLPRTESDFENRIQRFQSSLKKLDADNLKADLAALEKQQSELDQSRELSKLEENRSRSQSDLESERQKLTKLTNTLDSEVRRITQELENQSREETRQIDEQIEELRREIEGIGTDGT